MNNNGFIPFHVPSIGDEEIDEVVATLRSGWLTTGPRTAQFEREFREYVEAPFALAVNSCTAGLHLAFAALGIGPGDEVITTPLTFCATVNTILHTGATPVLADVDADGNLDPESVQKRITPRTRAIVPVHLAGKPCDMERLWALARQYSLFVVEDAAHAAGAHYRGRQIGAGIPEQGYYSDAVAYSFYATKNLTTGEGGMVTTHNSALYERMKRLCLHGISKDAWNRYTAEGNWYYQVTECGFKYNLSDIQSAIGIHQLRKLEGFIATRSTWAGLYQELLQDVEELDLPQSGSHCRHAWHLYVIRLRPELLDVDRAGFIRQLRSHEIGTSVHFIPIPLHPFYASHATQPRSHYENALSQYERSISLPLYPAMSESQIRRVVDAVKDVLLTARKSTNIAVGV